MLHGFSIFYPPNFWVWTAKTQLILANLVVEYIGCVCFGQVVQQVNPQYVSCVIQVNNGAGWVSDSPYLHAFDGLEQVYHSIDANMLRESMTGIGYRFIGNWVHSRKIKSLAEILPRMIGAGEI